MTFRLLEVRCCDCTKPSLEESSFAGDHRLFGGGRKLDVDTARDFKIESTDALGLKLRKDVLRGDLFNIFKPMLA